MRIENFIGYLPNKANMLLILNAGILAYPLLQTRQLHYHLSIIKN